MRGAEVLRRILNACQLATTFRGSNHGGGVLQRRFRWAKTLFFPSIHTQF